MPGCAYKYKKAPNRDQGQRAGIRLVRTSMKKLKSDTASQQAQQHNHVFNS